VTQAVLERIQAMLRSGELAPGQPLPSQRQLAEDLQVSRASLREALSILGTLGLIRIEQGRGTFVAAPTDGGEVPGAWRYGARYTPAEVYQFRLIAEPSTAALAARNATPAQLQELERNLSTFKAAARAMDLVSTAQLDFEFHELIAACSGNRLLVDLHRTYRHVVLDSQRLPLAKRSRLWEPAVEHERILKALSMHDPEGAAYYMRVHISRAADRVGAEVVDAGG
jgi:GntR family transcriptional repressor for pyruvate dehydrogenase complex